MTLAEILPYYLNTGLKFITEPELEQKIQTLKMGDIRQSGFITITDVLYNNKLKCIPLFRPLSDLTKEIEHNGERFVPLRELNVMRGVTTRWGISPQLEMFQQLFKWHIDVFEAIDQGLALDLNKVEI